MDLVLGLLKYARNGRQVLFDWTFYRDVSFHNWFTSLAITEALKVQVIILCIINDSLNPWADNESAICGTIFHGNLSHTSLVVAKSSVNTPAKNNRAYFIICGKDRQVIYLGNANSTNCNFHQRADNF